jgi:hypothetical protein
MRGPEPAVPARARRRQVPDPLPLDATERYLLDHRRGASHVARSAVGPPFHVCCNKVFYVAPSTLSLARPTGAPLCDLCCQHYLDVVHPSKEREP